MIGNKMHDKQDGAVDAFIATIIAMFFLITVVYLSIQPLTQASINNQVQDITRTAILRCEADGGLTTATYNLILHQFSSDGLDPSLVTITFKRDGVVSPISDSYPAITTFGNDINLKISYEYNYKEKIGTGFNIKDGNTKTIIISKSISTTAKD